MFGGPGRSRTCDLLHAMEALYQLSYRPIITMSMIEVKQRFVKHLFFGTFSIKELL